MKGNQRRGSTATPIQSQVEIDANPECSSSSSGLQPKPSLMVTDEGFTVGEEEEEESRDGCGRRTGEGFLMAASGDFNGDFSGDFSGDFRRRGVLCDPAALGGMASDDCRNEGVIEHYGGGDAMSGMAMAGDFSGDKFGGDFDGNTFGGENGGDFSGEKVNTDDLSGERGADLSLEAEEEDCDADDVYCEASESMEPRDGHDSKDLFIEMNKIASEISSSEGWTN